MSIDGSYTYEIWRPSVFALVPRGMPLVPFAAWWLFHHSRVFANRDYALFLIHQGGRIVHRSVITPGYFRFPFMQRDDLQIGDTWTSDDHRGKGLATFALRQITESGNSGRCYWYVVEERNTASIRVVEKAGFCRVGRGARHPHLGLHLLGTFEIEQEITPSCLPR